MNTPKTWVIAAGGEIARVFDYSGGGKTPVPVSGETWHAEKEMDFVDKQGVGKSRIGASVHRMAPHTGPDHEHLVFARAIAGKLVEAQAAGRFERLVLCAAPAMLGLLRQEMPKALGEAVVAEFDKDLPNYGLVPPPEADPYVGHFNIEIPLGGDINGNGENDKIKFTLATHSVGDDNRTWIELPDGTIQDSFDSGAFMQGAVVDESSDPPFTIGAVLPGTGVPGLPDPMVFGGPTMATGLVLTAVKNPGFSYVDANNDHLYDDADGDVPLEPEIDDGKFDTRKKEGNYTTVIKGAGLVINDGPTDVKKFKYQCDGDLVINEDLTAEKQVFLRSRDGSARW